MKTNTPPDPEQLSTVADYLANLTLWELAEIGRPTTPPKKPEARFVRCDGDKFIYHVRGKNFHHHDRLKVQGLMRPKGHTDEEIKASALSNAKELDKLLLREVAYSRKIIAANAVRRITETLKAEAS